MRVASTWEDGVATAPVGIAVVGLDGRYVAVNPAFCRFTGREEAGLLGTWYLDPVHPDDRATNLEQGQRLLAGEVAS